MYNDTKVELEKILSTLTTIAVQLNQMEQDEEIENANAIGNIADGVRDAIRCVNIALSVSVYPDTSLKN